MTPNIADTPIASMNYDVDYAAEQEGPVLTDHEIVRLKQALAQTETASQPGRLGYSEATALVPDPHVTLFYLSHEIENVRQSAQRQGHHDIAGIVAEALDACMRKWFDLRKGPQ